MAFQKQFKTSYYSYNGWEYYMEIWVNTTAGTITTSEVKLGTGGPIISYDTDNEDRFSPIISSNCVIPLVIESSIQETFVKQLREVYNERDVYVHLYRATEAQHSTVKPLWSGFVLMDLSSTPDEFYPYDFKITAVDGLGLLKDIDFVKPTTRRANEYIQADMYYGPGRFTYWLKEILLKTGASTTVEGSSQDYEFTTAINWYESLMPNTSQSTDPFYITKCSVGMFHTKTDDGVYEVTNCYEVLKELLKHWGARITYWKGQFWIVQIPQYITPDSGTYINPDNVNTRTYDKSGTFIGSSDNLGDSYWTRYQLNIGDIDGGIQKLTGTNVNYLPQIREVRANNISFGGGNRYGGFPREFAGNSAPDEIIFQDQITDASDSDSFNLVIPLNVNVENGNPFYMKILFNFYCTDLTNTYYLQYDTTLTHKYYWVDISQWTTLVKAPTWDSGFISPATGNSNQSQSHIIEGFDEQILFKLYNTSTQVFSDLDLSGDYKFYLDIDAYGTNISNPGSFRFKFANGGLGVSQFFYPTHPTINVTWTNTLQSNYALQTPNIITNNAPNGNSIIQLTTPNIDPFEGMFVIITNTTGSIYGNSYVSSVNTSDVAIVDFGTLIFGDTLQSSDLGCLQVYNGTSFEKSSSSGNWGVGILTGSLAFTQILLDEYLYGQTVVIESPSMRLVTSEVNKQSSDGSGLRPNYVNPIGRLKESRTNLADVQYVFKRGAFYTLTDEWDYDGFEIKRNVDTIVKTVKNITGPNNPVTGVGSISKTATIPNSFGQVISKQIITSISSSVAAGTITSLPIALINDVVFKIGDYFNVLNSDTNEFIKFELNAQQFSDSSSLTVVSQVIADNIPANSIITFNAFDLTSQYQNKTRGTVGAFDITATSIDSGSVAISSYIDDDTFATASVNSLATSESIKAYVDGQAGHDETLQQVTDNGNTTTNSIMIGSSSSPSEKLEVVGNIRVKNNGQIYADGTGNLFIGNTNSGILKVGGDVNDTIISSSFNNLVVQTSRDQDNIIFKGGNSISEIMRIDTSAGNVGIGTTSPLGNLQIGVGGGGTAALFSGFSGVSHGSLKMYAYGNTTPTIQISANNSGTGGGTTYFNSGNVGIGTSSPSGLLHISSGTSGDSIVIIESDTDNNNENDNPQLQFKQDGGNTIAKLGLNGDANTRFTNSLANAAYFGNDEAASVQLYTNLSARLTIDSNGNVGINQQNPTEKLHVVGDALITGDLMADAYKPEAAANPIKFKNFGSTELARITDGGNFLVGTTSENASFGNRVVINKNGSGLTIPLRIENLNNISGDLVSMQFALKRAGSEKYAYINADATTNTKKVDFVFQLSDEIDRTVRERMRITGEGGIAFGGAANYGTSGQVLKSNGNASPAWVDASSVIGGPYLPLTGGSLTGALTGTSATFNGDVLISKSGEARMKVIETTNNNFLQIYQQSTDSYIIAGTATGTPTQSLLFYTGGGEKMRLTSGGSLLLGTTSSGRKLCVQGTNNTALSIVSPNTNYVQLALGDTDDDNYAQILLDNNTNILQIQNGGGGIVGNRGITLDSSENVGINTFSPTEKLHVVGKGIFTDQVTIPATPVATTDAASKSYVDAHGGGLGPFLPLTAGSSYPLTGDLNIVVNSSGGAAAGSDDNLILEDNGNSFINIKTPSTSVAGILFSDATRGRGQITYSHSDDALRFVALGAEKMRLNSSGRLGIGTSFIQGKLDIKTSESGFEFFPEHSTDTNLIINYDRINSNYLSIQTRASSHQFLIENTEKMRLTSGGNLGLGTSSPTTRLDLGAGNTQEDGLGFGSNLSEIRRGNSGLNLQMSHWGNISMIIDSDGNDSSRFFNVMHNNNDSSSATELFRVQENGNVLIGTTTDYGDKLYVNGNIRLAASGILYLWTGHNHNYLQYYRWEASTGNLMYINNGGSGGFGIKTGNTERMRITSAGNLLIGSTSDNGAKLQVTGIIRTTGGSVQAGQDYGFTLQDESNNNRYGLKFGAAGSVGGSNLLMLTNRSLSSATGGGEVAIGANASTTGVTETEVMRIKANTQSEVSIDGILSLTVQDTPADPSNNKSSIWLDSNWDLKIKITNSSGDTVTKTIVEYA